MIQFLQNMITSAWLTRTRLSESNRLDRVSKNLLQQMYLQSRTALTIASTNKNKQNSGGEVYLDYSRNTLQLIYQHEGQRCSLLYNFQLNKTVRII
jgi:hypothetical protein